MNKKMLDDTITYGYNMLIRKLCKRFDKDAAAQALTEAYISLLNNNTVVVENNKHCFSLLYREATFSILRRLDRVRTFEDLFDIEWASDNTPEHSTIVKHQLAYLRNKASKDLLTYMECGTYSKAAKVLKKHPVTLRQQLYGEMAVLRDSLPFKHIHEEGSTYSYYKVKKDIDKNNW